MPDITGVDLRPFPIPASLDASDAHDFRVFTDLRNAIYREIAGSDDDAMTAEELLPHYQPNPEEIRFAWFITLEGEPIGRATIDIPLEEGSRNAFWIVELLRAHQGRGIGNAVYPLIERRAREHGRTVLQSWAQHPETPGPRLAPPTGFGSIPDDRPARFYRHHGYRLEQVERQSELDLAASGPLVARLLAEAEAAAVGYRIVQWQAPTPAHLADGYAWMKSRMSTDTPMGALEFDEEVWDAARVQRNDQRIIDGARTMLVTAAQHIDSGDLVAFNELIIGGDRTGPTHQNDTLVLRAHRGHRLGQLVKCAALKTWVADVAPHSPKVITYNAEENRPMLDINERIGFVPVAYNGAWKKVLA